MIKDINKISHLHKGINTFKWLKHLKTRQLYLNVLCHAAEGDKMHLQDCSQIVMRLEAFL